MYAITHAATALILKRRFNVARIWPLLVSVQAVELLWVIFVYIGIEHVVYTRRSQAITATMRPVPIECE